MNGNIKYVLGTALAVASLAVIIPKAKTQTAPPPTFHSGGLTIIPGGGYGSAPVVIGPNGMQRITPGLDPYGWFDFTGDFSMPNAYNVSFGPNDIPRTSDTITARKEANNRLYVRWQGEPRAVRNITFALLDGNNRVVSQQTITSLPTEARLLRTAKTASYSVTVQYINGTTTSIVSPLDHSSSMQNETVGPDKSKQVAIDNSSFSAAILTVRPGTKVTWINYDTMPHTVTATKKRFTSPVLKPGEAFSYTFKQAGEYSYFCSIHPEMRARIVVK